MTDLTMPLHRLDALPRPAVPARSPRPARPAPLTASLTASLTAVLTVLLASLAACGSTDDATATAAATVTPPTVPVVLADVTRDSIQRPITGTGAFGARDEVSLSFKIGGIVETVAVDEGARVGAGTVLASLDLREISALQNKAKVALDKARRDLARAQSLYADSVTPLAQLQDAESAVAAAEADWETASVNREYAVITAPGSGRILRRRVEPGALVAPGSEVLVFGREARGFVVRLGIPDRDAVLVRNGQRATVRFTAMPEQRYAGRVVQRGAATDPRTGMVSVEVAVDGASGLPSGTIARVSIDVPASQLVTLVPVDALLEADGDSASVYSVRDGVAQRHVVEVLFLADERVAVRGLDGVGQVITSGASYVATGTPVQVTVREP